MAVVLVAELPSWAQSNLKKIVIVRLQEPFKWVLKARATKISAFRTVYSRQINAVSPQSILAVGVATPLADFCFALKQQHLDSTFDR